MPVTLFIRIKVNIKRIKQKYQFYHFELLKSTHFCHNNSYLMQLLTPDGLNKTRSLTDAIRFHIGHMGYIKHMY